MSHTSIASTRDYIAGRDRGDLTHPGQAASFTSDPLLTPISVSSLPRPMLPDPTPSSDPSAFDASTGHPHSHYHPEAKLSKKKRAKRLGLGYVGAAHGGGGGLHAGGRTFSEHDKEAHERAERRDAAIGPAAAEQDEEWETDEDDDGEAQQAEQSHRQHHENRVTGTESGHTQPMGKRNQDVADSLRHKDDQEADKDSQEHGKESADKSDHPSLMQRASNVLASAQQRATGMASGVASSVMSTAQSVPVVGSLLSKVGLGAPKADKADDSSAGGDGAEQTEEAGQDDDQAQQQQGAGGSGSAGQFKEGSKVGGNREAETEGLTKGAGEQATTEAATRKGGGELYGKQGARQDNNEGALDKSRSHAGQKDAASVRAVNKQATKEEEA